MAIDPDEAIKLVELLTSELVQELQKCIGNRVTFVHMTAATTVALLAEELRSGARQP